MNNKTRELARRIYNEWREEVMSYAPSDSHIMSFEEQYTNLMRRAVKLKKTLQFRRDGF
jgi:hypothetical protein